MRFTSCASGSIDEIHFMCIWKHSRDSVHVHLGALMGFSSCASGSIDEIHFMCIW